jgi:arylsulfatase A
MRFTDCYAGSALCSPSRAALLTGRAPDRCGVYDWIPENSPMHLPRTEVSFARLLRDAGYATGHFGKWHLNGKLLPLDRNPAQAQPPDHGFEVWFSTQNNAAPSHHEPNNFVYAGRPVGTQDGYSSTVIVDEAVGWLRAIDPHKPFCLFLCFHSPHEPIATAPEFSGMYPQAESPEQAAYFGNVSQLDHEFGRLLDMLDRFGRRQNSFVLFTSDNGPETRRIPGTARSFGSAGPLRDRKASLYEGGYRVPGIVQWPGRVKPGSVSAEPVANYDLLPTVCEIAGLRPPRDRKIDGASLMPALRGGRIARPVPLHWHFYRARGPAKATLRDGDWKLVGLVKSAQPPFPPVFDPNVFPAIRSQALEDFELYNLRTDIGEKENLAAREPARLKRMADRLIALHREVRAEGRDWRSGA